MKSLTVTQLMSGRAGMQTWACLTLNPGPLLEKQCAGHPGGLELSRGDKGTKKEPRPPPEPDPCHHLPPLRLC